MTYCSHITSQASHERVDDCIKKSSTLRIEVKEERDKERIAEQALFSSPIERGREGEHE